jgi:hypothetical protein
MANPTCTDLREFAGERYRVWNETENRKAYERDDPWDLVIPGIQGFVAPHGGELLVACTNSQLLGKRILKKLPGAILHQDASDGMNILFHLSYFSQIAEFLRLKKRRRLTEEQKKVLAVHSVPFAKRPSAEDVGKAKENG